MLPDYIVMCHTASVTQRSLISSTCWMILLPLPFGSTDWLTDWNDIKLKLKKHVTPCHFILCCHGDHHLMHSGTVCREDVSHFVYSSYCLSPKRFHLATTNLLLPTCNSSPYNSPPPPSLPALSFQTPEPATRQQGGDGDSQHAGEKQHAVEVWISFHPAGPSPPRLQRHDEQQRPGWVSHTHNQFIPALRNWIGNMTEVNELHWNW